MNDRDFYHCNSIAQLRMMKIYAVVNTNQFKIYVNTNLYNRYIQVHEHKAIQ